MRFLLNFVSLSQSRHNLVLLPSFIFCSKDEYHILFTSHYVHNIWGAGQMHYKKTVPAVKSLQPRQKRQIKFRGKETYYEKTWNKEIFKVSWIADVVLILFLNIPFYWQRLLKIFQNFFSFWWKKKIVLWKHKNGFKLSFELNLCFSEFSFMSWRLSCRSALLNFFF